MSERKKNVLQQLITEVVLNELKELARPDAPKSAPFERYLFAPQRKNVSEEPNTNIEDKFLAALNSHYQNYSEDLERMWPLLWSMKQKGQYKRFLDPPQKPVYRYLSNLTPKAASKILGISVKDITSMPNEAQYIAASGMVGTESKNIQSWSINPALEGLKRFIRVGNERVVVLLVADPKTSGQFLLNPINLAKETGNRVTSDIVSELEVASYGPTNIVGSAFVYTQNYVPILSDKKIKRLFAKHGITGESFVSKEALQKIIEEIKEVADQKGIDAVFSGTGLVTTNNHGQKEASENMSLATLKTILESLSGKMKSDPSIYQKMLLSALHS